MGFCLYFYLTLVGYLILFGVGIGGGLVLFLQLQMVLGSVTAYADDIVIGRYLASMKEDFQLLEETSKEVG